MKKKIITMILVTGMVLSMAACGSQSKKTQGASADATVAKTSQTTTQKSTEKEKLLQVADVMPIVINGVKFDKAPLAIKEVYQAICGHKIEKDWEATDLKPGESAMFTANNKKGEMIASLQVTNNTKKTIKSDEAEVSNMTLIGKAGKSDLTYSVLGLTNTTQDVNAAKRVMSAYRVKNDASANAVKWFLGVDEKAAKAEKKDNAAQNELSMVFVDSGKKQQNWLTIYFPV